MSSGKLPDITKANINKAADSITANNSSFHTQLIALLKFAKTVWPQQHIASYANYLQLKEQIIALLDTAKDNAKNITESLGDDPNARDMETTFQELTENINTIHTFLDHAEGKYKQLITTVITEIDKTLQASESALGDQEYTQKMTNKREKLRKDQVMFTVQKLAEQEIITIDHTTKTITLHENYTQNDLETLKTQISQVIKLKNDSTGPSAWLTQVAEKVGYTYQEGVEAVRATAVVKTTDTKAEVGDYSPEALALACLTQLTNIDWAKKGPGGKPLFTVDQDGKFIVHKYGDKQGWGVNFQAGLGKDLRDIIKPIFGNEDTGRKLNQRFAKTFEITNIPTNNINTRGLNAGLLDYLIPFLCKQAKLHVEFKDHADNTKIQKNEEKVGEKIEGSQDIVNFLDTLARMNFSNDETGAFHPFITIDHEKHEVRLHPLDPSSLSLGIKQATWYKKGGNTIATKLGPSTLNTLIKHIFTGGKQIFKSNLYKNIFKEKTEYSEPLKQSMSGVEFVERLKILCAYIGYNISSNDKEGAEAGAGVGTEGAAATVTIERKGEANTKPAHEDGSIELQTLGTQIYEMMTHITVTLPDNRKAKLCHKLASGTYVFALITTEEVAPQYISTWKFNQLKIWKIDDKSMHSKYITGELLQKFIFTYIKQEFKTEGSNASKRFGAIQIFIEKDYVTGEKFKMLFTNNPPQGGSGSTLFQLAAMNGKALRAKSENECRQLGLLGGSNHVTPEINETTTITSQQAKSCLNALTNIDWVENGPGGKPLFIINNNTFIVKQYGKRKKNPGWGVVIQAGLGAKLSNAIMEGINTTTNKGNKGNKQEWFEATFPEIKGATGTEYISQKGLNDALLQILIPLLCNKAQMTMEWPGGPEMWGNMDSTPNISGTNTLVTEYDEENTTVSDIFKEIGTHPEYINFTNRGEAHTAVRLEEQVLEGYQMNIEKMKAVLTLFLHQKAFFTFYFDGINQRNKGQNGIDGLANVINQTNINNHTVKEISHTLAAILQDKIYTTRQANEGCKGRINEHSIYNLRENLIFGELYKVITNLTFYLANFRDDSNNAADVFVKQENKIIPVDITCTKYDELVNSKKNKIDEIEEYTINNGVLPGRVVNLYDCQQAFFTFMKHYIDLLLENNTKPNNLAHAARRRLTDIERNQLSTTITDQLESESKKKR